MIKVYFESKGAAEVVAIFDTEELFTLCLPMLKDKASSERMILTESVDGLTIEDVLEEKSIYGRVFCVKDVVLAMSGSVGIKFTKGKAYTFADAHHTSLCSDDGHIHYIYGKSMDDGDFFANYFMKIVE